MEVTITAGSAEAAAQFMAVEWPPYNAGLGIEWAPANIVLIANVGEAVGVACGTVIGGVGELKQILVKGGTDKRGVGSQLLEEFERRCRALGCHKLRLETADYQARPFLRKAWLRGSRDAHERSLRTRLVRDGKAAVEG